MTRGRLLLCALAFIACGDHVAVPPNVAFDGARAMEYAKAQVDAGPRVPGTPAAKNVGDWIVKNLRQYADTVIEQTWTHVTANKKDTLPLRNIFARFNPKAAKRILYISHWDSKPRADQSFADDDKKRPVPGANDGASSTAMLMELAEILKRTPTTVGVDLLFTDAEDYGTFNPDIDVLVGAQYFADHPLPDSSYRPTFGVLFDMIGDKDLKIYKETNSQQAAPDVNDRLWQMAAAMGYAAYFSPDLEEVGDDHLPLIKKGFHVIDVIDIHYDAWHKVTDTMDKISAQSLEIVGRVALAMIRAEESGK